MDRLGATGAEPPSPAAVVLQSDRAPGGGTRFVDQVVRYAPGGVQYVFFSWKRAILGRYDVFHVHWPEFLVRGTNRPKTFAKTLLFLAFTLRLKLTRTPVMRTVHNIAPHHAGPRHERVLLALLDRQVRLNVAVNGSTPMPEKVPHVLIPHGDYREVFETHPAMDPSPGKVLAFGRIERYKAFDRLIEAFQGVRGEYTLRIAGRGDTAVVRELTEQAAADGRISTRFEFLTDAELVAEVTSSEVVVLPYPEVHNSGVALVALSLNRPIIARRGLSTELLKAEVGGEWVYLYDGELTADRLDGALSDVRAGTDVRGAVAQLVDRSWHEVASKYAAAAASLMRPRDTPQRLRSYFINPSGQRDNLGDSVLRRPYLEHLRTLGTLHVYAGTNDSYISGLGLKPADIVYRSRRTWLQALIRNSVRRTVSYAINAGEIVLDRRYLAITAWQLPVSALVRAAGGSILALGIATRSQPRFATPALKATLSLATRIAWRDPSSGVIRRESVMPDWAFALSPQSSVSRSGLAERDVLAIGFRSDRPALNEDEKFALVSLAEELSLRIVVVTQVERDEAANSILARDIGAETLAWPPGRTHAEQERSVRELYGRARLVISDRIHALIIGATEHALPVGYSTTSDEKIARTFAPVLRQRISTDRHHGASDELRTTVARVLATETAILGQIDQAKDLIERAVTTRNDLQTGKTLT